MRQTSVQVIVIILLTAVIHVHAADMVVFSSRTESFYQLMTLDVSTGDIRGLTRSPGDKHNPAWSPDGRRIAFESEGRIVLLTMDDQRTPVRESVIDAITDRAGDPRWVSDTELLYTVYSNVISDHTAIWLIDLESGHRRKRFDEPYLDRQCDSRSGILAWVCGSETFGYEIQIWRNDSEGSFRITNNHVNDFDPRISPDGCQIAYQQYDGTSSAIKVRTLFSDKTQQIGFPDCFNGQPSWDFEGKTLYWVSDTDGIFRLYRTSLEFSDPELMTPSGMIIRDPDVRRFP